jgi:alkylated DNA nucleotide flippase Atl1
MTAQHDEARKLLPMIVKAAKSNQFLTYQDIAEKLGRPRDNARSVAQVCDLLDSAAALADVPLLALVVVLNAQKKINPKAWTAKEVEPGIRDGIIKRSKGHTFTEADFKAIAEALEKLKGKSNRTAWKYLSQFMPSAERRRRLAGIGTETVDNAIDDLGTDSPAYIAYTGKRYARKPTAPASPWQNGFAERLIGSIRRECLDHVIIRGEAHLRRILKSYADYYNGVRTHRSLNKDAPVTRQFSESEASNHTPSLAGFTTTTPELKFSVHTGRNCFQFICAVTIRAAGRRWRLRSMASPGKQKPDHCWS